MRHKLLRAQFSNLIPILEIGDPISNEVKEHNPRDTKSNVVFETKTYKHPQEDHKMKQNTAGRLLQIFLGKTLNIFLTPIFYY